MRSEDVPAEFNLATHFVDRNHPDRTALVTDAGPTSYGTLAAEVNRIGNALRAVGVGRGDRVLFAMSDGVPFVAAWYAAQKIGAVTAEVYSYLQPAEYRRYLEYVRPAVVVADGSTVARLRPAVDGGRRRVPLLVAGPVTDQLRPGELSLAALVAEQPDTLDAAGTGRDDIAIWKFTTGSTGAARACLLPARSPLLSFEWYASGVLGLRADDLVLPVPKLFFGYARDLTALFPFGVGAAGIVFPQRSTPEVIFELIERHRPTVLVNVPTMMRAMVAHQDAARHDLSSLRLCTSAGEALPAELHRRWLDTFGVEVVDGLGSSEAYHIYLSNRPGAVRPGTLGRPVPGYRLRLLDEAGDPVPPGEPGMLEVTGETVATGYWDAPERSAATFPAPHTVRSGDLLSRDADGFYHYRGRADELLKVGGVWVAPAEIEHCLLTHPAVAGCAVVGYQDGGLTRPRAFVVPRAEVTAEQLRAYVRATLAPYKYPRDIRFVDRLPETASGKLDRAALRTLA